MNTQKKNLKYFQMEPRIEIIHQKKLIGKRLRMNLVNNRTAELWRTFMQRRKEIVNHLTNEVLSLQVYESSYFEKFDPNNEFEKWALIEVSDFENIPQEMEPFTLMGGKYAVFNYKGLSTDKSIFQYIYSNWLPNSKYMLDERPHFELLGEKYKNNDPNSEEEIWIPIKIRQ